MSDSNDDALDALKGHAYDAMDRGDLAEASKAFDDLLQTCPESASFHYMRGLVHKYQRDWPTSLQHNLRAIELSGEVDEAHHWNAAIAATALGEWQQVRALWSACGVRTPDGEGPIHGDYGVAVVRLCAWNGGETVFVRRIDPVRGRVLNVPLPESGHRFGDIVLHDGASTGRREDGDGREVHVFNELERLIPSEFRTFVVFVRGETAEDLHALLGAAAPGIGYIEDWTDTIDHYCLRCSYGSPHRHDSANDDEWQPDRNLGIAAQSRASVDHLLARWTAAGRGRSVDGIEVREVTLPEQHDGRVWWRGPDDDD